MKAKSRSGVRNTCALPTFMQNEKDSPGHQLSTDVRFIQESVSQVWTEFVEGRVEWCVSTEILSEYMEILEQKTNAWFAEVIVNAIVNNENTHTVQAYGSED